MIDIQRACVAADAPADALLVRAAQMALDKASRHGALTVRIVASDDMQALNAGYRGKDAPTNVLSFAQDVQDENGMALLGDVVLCADVIREQAQQQGKSCAAHYQHMVVHGTLHLLGYDHADAADANAMERLECDILAALGVSDPYTLPTTGSLSDHSDRTVIDV